MTIENIDLTIRLIEILELQKHIEKEQKRLEILEEEFWVLNPLDLDLDSWH